MLYLGLRVLRRFTLKYASSNPQVVEMFAAKNRNKAPKQEPGAGATAGCYLQHAAALSRYAVQSVL